jgi:hypothetical protein
MSAAFSDSLSSIRNGGEGRGEEAIGANLSIAKQVTVVLLKQP